MLLGGGSHPFTFGQSLWVFPGFYLLVALLLISSFFLDIRPMGYDLAPVSYIIVEVSDFERSSSQLLASDAHTSLLDHVRRTSLR